MIDFPTMLFAYSSAIQCALMAGNDRSTLKKCNELLHHFCKSLVETSQESDNTKSKMKADLEMQKEIHDWEIDRYFGNGS